VKIFFSCNAKRIFDLFFALVGLIVVLPLLAVVGLITKSSDKGPVIFKQERIGLNGKPFILYKIRTMYVKETTVNEGFNAGDITRVTPIGRVLRKFKIDELPQLVNVIKGEMSLVGPRPEVQKWVAAYPERWQKILTVVPGITDNTAILFRDEETLLCQCPDPEKMYRQVVLPQKLTMYENYIEYHTLFGDIKLILQTICICFFSIRQNAPDSIFTGFAGRK
jgi:lipopolysaccharide/colanic/teichoic acid biosynthesis glycosyltransferase